MISVSGFVNSDKVLYNIASPRPKGASHSFCQCPIIFIIKVVGKTGGKYHIPYFFSQIFREGIAWHKSNAFAL